MVFESSSWGLEGRKWWKCSKGKLQGKIRDRRHPRPLCMHGKLRGKAGREQEEQSWE